MNEKINDILKEYFEKVILNLIPNNYNFNSTIWFEIADKILQNVKDLYIETNSNTIDTLKYHRRKKLSSTHETTGNVYLNEKYTAKICRNIKSLTFNSFYPKLLIKLVDNGIISINNTDYYTVFKYLVNNRAHFKNSDSYIIVKIMINYFYGMLNGASGKTKISCENFENFDDYKSLIFDDIKEKLKNDLIYLDTDCFYYRDNNYKFDFDIPYEIENIDEFVILRKKQFIIINNKCTEYHGFQELK